MCWRFWSSFLVGRDQLICIARIVRTRGIHGEVVAEVLTDFPERFATVESVILSKDEKDRPAILAAHRFHQDRVLLTFEGYSTPEQTRELVGSLVHVPASEAVELEPDQYFEFDLHGCRVLDSSGAEIGTVASVYRGSGDVSNLTVETSSGDEVMIPMVDEFIKSVDLDRRTIVADAPDELLQLNRKKQ